MNSDNEYDRELRRLTQYADQTLSNVVKSMLTSVFSDCPEDPIEVRTYALCPTVHQAPETSLFLLQARR
jgi:hypothetical protein